ncbi:Rv1733c family protein [Streptomyces liangshanensis]|uniref:Rv1733c family protein n=1 Tax=Streptomyces liangshanensis TaxID=2717324 RepID=UPI0036D8CC91
MMRVLRPGPGLWWRWRRNPLRRRSDAVEAWMLPVVGALALTVAVLGGLLASQGVRSAADGQRAQRHSTSAVVLADTPVGPASAGRADGDVPARVRWTAPDGAARTARISVPGGQRAGSTVRIWVDARGRPVPPPATPDEADFHATLLGGLAALVSGGTVLCFGALARQRLYRQRMRHWSEEWDRIAPEWSRGTL